MTRCRWPEVSFGQRCHPAGGRLTGLRVARRQLRWSRAVGLDTRLADIGSRSAFLVLDEADRHAFLVAERERLGRAYPGEEVEETYVVDLLVASRS
ncbi:hypothetical protein ACL07V_36780 [Streptomyces sp. MB22_4]|uniref:hypothetical protein n=1 Tax=Streptomyces sp. MB22_4 TaxID=3383120 RepID=UPI00399F0DC4